MNKKIFFGFVVVSAIVSLIAVNIHLGNKSAVLDISLAQIEALANEDFPSAKKCYTETWTGMLTQKVPCFLASGTYPCQSEAYGYYGTTTNDCY
jgi:hypothetical protein